MWVQRPEAVDVAGGTEWSENEPRCARNRVTARLNSARRLADRVGGPKRVEVPDEEAGLRAPREDVEDGRDLALPRVEMDLVSGREVRRKQLRAADVELEE